VSDFDLDAMLRSILNEEAPPIVTAPPATVTTVVTPPKDVPVFKDSALREDDRIELPPLVFPEFTSKDIAETLDIRNYATMVKLRTRKWAASVKDKRLAQDVSRSEGASKEAFRVYKSLFAGAEERLKAVHKVIDAGRMEHYKRTMPWSTTGVDESGRRDGPRLLPNVLFMEYVTDLGRAKQELKGTVLEFRQAYPSMVEAAKRNLGTAFDETQYPPESMIEDYFALDFDFSPIPTGVDFKGLPAQQVAQLKNRMDANVRTCLENAMKDVWQRLHTVVTHMAERLGDNSKTFHDTLVSNVKEIAVLGHSFNATNDVALTRILKRVEQELCLVEPKELRESVLKRATVAGSAREILADMKRAAQR